MPRKRNSQTEICRFCKSSNTIRWCKRKNKYQTKQRYFCKDCERTFVPNDGFIGFSYPPKAICEAFELFFSGLSLKKIKKHILRNYGFFVSCRTILNWIRQLSVLIYCYTFTFAKTHKAKISGAWHADETEVKNKKKKRWIWTLTHKRNGFLISIRYSKRRTQDNAKAMYKEGKTMMKKPPKRIVSDKNGSYRKAFNKYFYNTGVKIVHGVPIASKKHGLRYNNNTAEEMIRIIKDWYRHMNGFSSDDSANDLVKGFWAFYNFIQPQDALKWKTPAEAVGFNLKLPHQDRVAALVRIAVSQ